MPYLIVVGVRYVEGDEITADNELQLSEIKKVTRFYEIVSISIIEQDKNSFHWTQSSIDIYYVSL